MKRWVAWISSLDNEMPTDVCCPSCGHRFQSPSVQCVCPECECVFLKGQKFPAERQCWHIGEPVPIDFPGDEDLHDEELQLQHFLLHVMSNNCGADPRMLVEFQLVGAARTLERQGRIDRVQNGTFVLNESGIHRLDELNSRFGSPEAPWGR